MPTKRVSDKDLVVSAAVPARHKPATTKRANRTTPPAPPAAAEASAPVTQPVPAQLSQEQISCLAYSYWEARGFQGGTPEEDWLRAEQELLAATALA